MMLTVREPCGVDVDAFACCRILQLIQLFVADGCRASLSKQLRSCSIWPVLERSRHPKHETSFTDLRRGAGGSGAICAQVDLDARSDLGSLLPAARAASTRAGVVPDDSRLRDVEEAGWSGK